METKKEKEMNRKAREILTAFSNGKLTKQQTIESLKEVKEYRGEQLKQWNYI